MAVEANDALVLLGRAFALQQAGKLVEAENLYAQVLATTPDDVTALINAGAVAAARGDYRLAVTRFEHVTKVAPDNAAARSNLGFALIHAGRDADALAALDRAIELQPGYAHAHNNRGIVLARLHRHDEAIAAFERALTLEPRHAESAQNLGEQYNLAGEPARAIAAFERVLALAPDHANAHSGRAFARAMTGDLAGAITQLDALTQRHPQHAPAWQTLAAVRNWAWDHAGAETAFRRALSLDPANHDAAFGIASTLLARGDYEQGWPAFERRADRGIESGAAFSRLRVWDGSTLPGTLVVYGEQGLGDVVQFARFLSRARGRVGRLVLLLDGYRAPLAPLLAQTRGVDAAVVSADDPAVVSASARISMLSLPQRLGIVAEDLPVHGRYLEPPAEHVAKWRALLADATSPRVGLAWSVLVRDAHKFITRQRLLPISALLPVVNTPDTTFVTLQPGDAGDPAVFGEAAQRILDVRPEIRDFADTAALIDTLDLVICADTAVAHVAAALGKTVWMYDRANSCWRWRIASDTTPWYPTLRIFRQEQFGNWDTVAQRLAAAFAQWRRGLSAPTGT